jgi:A/G-specific adenine glycosylase
VSGAESAEGTLDPLTSAERREVVRRVLRWYRGNARDLPWRRPGTSPWQIMISEFMLQQTPVERVREPWQTWVDRWPTPASLAADPAGDAVRAWGRLGYPRRALRLHAAARVITDHYEGHVPRDQDELLRLPGVGSYTAAAILAFAYGQRVVVLDTNVRRVLARIAAGMPAAPPTATSYETVQANQFLPRQRARAARWAVASMELGALICTARGPRCPTCPVRDFCRWRRGDFPVAAAETARSRQSYDGTDRQCRGALLAAFRSADQPLPVALLAPHWPNAGQRQRALRSLVADGLLVDHGDQRYGLPD